VIDRLKEQGIRVEAFNAATSPKVDTKAEDYPNRRSEAWFGFADVVHLIDLDRDEQLLADLAAPLYKIDSRGRRVVEAKDATKRRLGRSPDRADAVVMLFAPHPSGRMRVARPHGLVTS
jgi:phage terminase large subunit